MCFYELLPNKLCFFLEGGEGVIQKILDCLEDIRSPLFIAGCMRCKFYKSMSY